MKNTIKLFGIIAIVSIIGFSMLACDTGSNGNNKSDSNGDYSGIRLEGSTWTTTVYGAVSQMTFSATTYEENVISSPFTTGFASRGPYTISGNIITITVADIGPAESLASVGQSSNMTIINENTLLHDFYGYFTITWTRI